MFHARRISNKFYCSELQIRFLFVLKPAMHNNTGRPIRTEFYAWMRCKENIMGLCLPEIQVNTVSPILTWLVFNCFAFRWIFILIRSNKYKSALKAKFGRWVALFHGIFLMYKYTVNDMLLVCRWLHIRMFANTCLFDVWFFAV